MTYRLITFDVFSALGNIRGTFVPILSEIEVFNDKDVSAFFAMWRNKQYEYMIVHNSLEREFMSFEEITRRTLDYTLYIHKINLPETTKEQLVQMWRRIKFWDDAHEVVQAVKERGYLIGMLSNGDEEMLNELAQQFGVEFDYIFSAEQIGYYKPSPSMYRLPYDKLGLNKGDYLHVAGSTTDILGAIASKTPCAWSNRHADVPLDLSFQPTYNMKNLSELLSYV